ncbi:peptidoglycan DD-metalloendopeptidase family protein [Acinetobacter sp. A47]|uniref:peptidoglycan DD-metalloendopeptidase family protein n=1 Tax=Acinetobacter sp. A47 TaxID=1561217 RepID=UPI000570538E|nr:peptidoglycan DD-metalloendopeptidase family protein [Acinetobacter sp. A47]
MHLNHVSFFLSQKMIKTIVLSMAVATVAVMTGCASKPQVNGGVRHTLPAPNYYTVRSGDTLSGISNRYGLNYLDVAALNDIAPPYRIYVNQSLRLKGSASQRTTSTQAMAQTAPIQRQSINLPTQQPVTPKPVVPRPVVPSVPVNPSSSTIASSLRWVKPSNGAVIQTFNLASNVKGTRYGGNEGDPVFAAANGQVVYAADGLKEYGNLVLIKHIDGYITAYAHNSRMLVKSGDNVTAGQKIAEMGSSGASRVMLEFQVRLDGKPVNPSTVLPN